MILKVSLERKEEKPWLREIAHARRAGMPEHACALAYLSQGSKCYYCPHSTGGKVGIQRPGSRPELPGT